MPSLNLSLPGLPVLSAGAIPVPVAPAASAAVPPGDSFAAMIASVGDAPMLDGAPVPKPGVGTPLPPDRQDPAGPPQPLLQIEVEDVMLGSAPVPVPVPAADMPVPQAASTPQSPKTSPTAGAVVDVPTELPAPAPPTAPAPADEPIACGLQIWTPHGRHGRAGPAPVHPLPIELPPQEVSDPLAEPEAFGSKTQNQDMAEPDQAPAGQDNAPLPAPAPAPLPAFAPVEWTRPARTESEPPQALPPETPAAAPSTAPVAANVQPAPAQPGAAAAVPAVQQAPELAPNESLQPQPAAPPHAAPAPALPNSFALPSEVAREVAELVRAAVRDADEPAPLPTETDTAAPAPIQSAPQPAAPLHREFAAAHRPAVDTSRGEWMQAMIERIAEMPQVDGRREAQIRLLPDALGAVEVRIEQRQDRLHVTFNAENAQARQLLAEAAPRLHELAEARGLRLGQTGIGGGEQQDRRPAPEQQPATPLRPRPAAAAAETESDSDGDLIA